MGGRRVSVGVCTEPGCPELVEGGRGRCAAHLAEARKPYDRARPSKRARGYDELFDRNRPRVLAEEEVCWICGRPVDKTLSGRDRMGPTVDHVVELEEGGTNERSNLRLAHLSCNSRRQAQRPRGGRSSRPKRPAPEPSRLGRAGSPPLR